MQVALVKCEVWIHHSRMELDKALESIVWIRTLWLQTTETQINWLEGRKRTYQPSGAKPGFRHGAL